MSCRNTIVSAIQSAIKDINETLPRDRKISLLDDAPLYGTSGVVDSLTLTLLIVAIEQKIEQSLNCTISLVEQTIMAETDNVFSTIATLSTHIESLINQKNQ